MGQMYGKHLPMQIRMELDILSQVQRLPGLPNSNLGMETILGRDDKIDFEDYLGGVSLKCMPILAIIFKHRLHHSHRSAHVRARCRHAGCHGETARH